MTEITPIHRLLAEVSDTDAGEWTPCDGPRPGSVRQAQWFVRRSEGHPDIYAIASSDEDETTIELIPAEPGEENAFQVANGALQNVAETVVPDIECGVLYKGEFPEERQPAPRI